MNALTRSSFPILIIATNVELEPYPVYPIGAAMIAASLEKRGFPVRGLDFSFLDEPIRHIDETIREFSPALIGISVRAVDNTCFIDQRSYLPAVRDLIRSLREITRVPIVIGGSGYSLFPTLMLEELGADFGIPGEGERRIIELADALRGRQQVAIPGVLQAGAETFECPPPLNPEQWLQPSLSCFPVDAHLAAGGMASVQTKRGCPLNCSYCTYPMLEGHGLRLRPPDEVVDDILDLKDRGINYLFFVDNNFNIPAHHGLEICRSMSARGAEMPWTAFLTPNGFTTELADAMAESGARSVEFGAESAAAPTLRGLGKHHTAEDILASDRSCHEAGVTAAHYFIFGGPGETPDTLEESLDVIHRLSGPVAACFGVRIYPGTGLHQRALAEGQVMADDPLLDPAFYFSPLIDGEKTLQRLSDVAAARGNFVLIGSDAGIQAELIQRLRQRGRKGPLWEYLRP